jgi:hypothetical protein
MERANSAIMEFLEEVYDGPKHSYTWFIGNEQGSGLLGTVRGVDAEEASTPVVEGGTTVAAHVGHLLWTLQKANSYMRGEDPSWDWSESWTVGGVGPEEWRQLIGSLEAEFTEVVQSLRPGVVWRSDEQYREILALIPHAAYHLGAVRQMVLVIRSGAQGRGSPGT